MEINVDKVERENKVAVLVSPGFGAGWSTWNGEYGAALVFCPRMVLAVLKESSETPEAVAAELFPDAFAGGLRDITVEWVNKDDRFEIHEYDGSETLRVFGPDDGYVA